MATIRRICLAASFLLVLFMINSNVRHGRPEDTQVYREPSQLATDKPKQRRKATSCYEYLKAASTHYVIDYDVTQALENTAIGNEDVTMVTHMSEERLNRLNMMITHWQGPITVSVYIKPEKKNIFLTKIQRRSNVRVHFVQVQGTFYPINFLRNVALNTTRTRFVFLNDIDFIPPSGSYQLAKEHVKNLKKGKVYVVPAFEEVSSTTHLADDFPQTKGRLVELWLEDVIRPFHSTEFEPAHKPTESTKWATTDILYEIQWARWYEPYVIGYTDEMPRYNQHLVGRYENKALQIAHIRAKRMKFIVLPNIFVLHLWHPLVTNNYSVYRCSHIIAMKCIRYLEKKYKVSLWKDTKKYTPRNK